MIGVNGFEQPEDKTDAAVDAVVRPFVAKQGDKMGYAVAGDGVAARMTETWFHAAGKEAIPASFIVGPDGRIAWIGFPVDLDTPLERVINGTWAGSPEQRAYAEATDRDARVAAFGESILTPFRAKRYAAALAAWDAAARDMPESVAHPDFISIRLKALQRTNPGAAVAYVRELTAETGPVTKNADFMWAVMRVLPQNAGDATFTKAQYAELANLTEPGVAKSNATVPAQYSIYANVAAEGGDMARAAKYQKIALDKLSDVIAKRPSGETTRKMLGQYKAKLNAYQAAANHG